MPYVAPTVEQLAEYLNTGLDTPRLQDSLDVAIALVDDFLGHTEIPQVIYTNEVLRTAHAVFKQSETTGGSQQVATLESVVTTRFAKDPLTAAYPVLTKWVVPF